MSKWVYTFGNGQAEGDASMRNLLGGKGANLAEMNKVGLPVPPGFTVTTEVCTYYYNNKKRGELDFVIALGGKVLPIEVKSGKDYETHRALSNIMDCKEYDLQQAVVFNNDNLRVAGKIVYAPVYMAMFLEKENTAPAYYKVDLSGL